MKLIIIRPLIDGIGIIRGTVEQCSDKLARFGYETAAENLIDFAYDLSPGEDVWLIQAYVLVVRVS